MLAAAWQTHYHCVIVVRQQIKHVYRYKIYVNSHLNTHLKKCLFSDFYFLTAGDGVLNELQVPVQIRRKTDRIRKDPSNFL